jgi:DNA-binding winged helix-turn-helix (wHTH) protein
MRVRFADCVFDPGTRELWRAERRVALSPKAYQLLALLIAQRPRPVPQADLRDALWPDTHVGYTSLARVVNELRQAVGDAAGSAALVRTVRGYGYAFAGAAVGETGPRDGSPCVLLCEDREFFLPEGETLVGRGPECGVRLASSRVSRVHAAVRVQGAQAHIEDRGSKNGTWVNGARLSGPVALEEGDEVLVGSYRLLFRASSSLDPTHTATSR